MIPSSIVWALRETASSEHRIKGVNILIKALLYLPRQIFILLNKGGANAGYLHKTRGNKAERAHPTEALRVSRIK